MCVCAAGMLTLPDTTTYWEGNSVESDSGWSHGYGSFVYLGSVRTYGCV